MSEKLRIVDIRIDGGTQSRAGLSRSYVEDYALLLQEAQEAGLENDEVVWPFRDPVEVYHDGEAYWLVDGFHRVEACKQVGRYVVQANVNQGTLRDAILASFAANAEHGLPRGHEDKKRAVRRMLADDEWSKWSSREVARCCKVSHTMVNKIRDEMQQSDTGNNSSMERIYIHPKTGRETVMNTANIVESNQSRSETAAPDDFTDELPPPHLAVWALERHVSAWLDSDSPQHAGFIHDNLDALRSIKEKKVGWRVPFDSIKGEIGLANYTDNDLRQAINNVINQVEIDRGNAVRNREQTAVSASIPEGKATAEQTATYWLKNYVDPVHNRIWSDLEDNQVHHANSPCAQAFRKQYPDIGDHKALLKAALANLRRERVVGIAESIKGLRSATNRLIDQMLKQVNLPYCVSALTDATVCFDEAVEAVETAVSEEA